MTTSIDTEAEGYVRSVARELIQPLSGECLACYIERMLRQSRCDGSLRFALAYRDACAPRATALARRLADAGGFCDDEVLMNAFWPAARLWTRRPRRDPAADDEEDDWEYEEEAVPPAVMPPCETVRRGSTQPCGLWEQASRRRARYLYY